MTAYFDFHHTTGGRELRPDYRDQDMISVELELRLKTSNPGSQKHPFESRRRSYPLDVNSFAMRGSRLKIALTVCALVVLAGCAGIPLGPATETGAPTDLSYESYVFDHADVDGAAIEDGITYPNSGTGPTMYYVTLVESAQSADRFNQKVLDATANTFIQNTSFDESSIVVIQVFPASSHPDYRVDSVRQSDEGLAIMINDSSTGGTADITVETVLLRVHDDISSPVTVTTEEGRQFSTGSGIVTVTKPTTTPEPDIEPPYASEDPRA